MTEEDQINKLLTMCDRWERQVAGRDELISKLEMRVYLLQVEAAQLYLANIELKKRLAKK